MLPTANTPAPGSARLEDIRPFRASQPHVPHSEGRVEGSVPSWLQGELVRTCPAVFQLPQWQAQHWFDGLGMLFAFRFRQGSVSFRSRLLESYAASQAAIGEARVITFDTPIQRSGWQRMVEPIARPTDNTNVNIVRLGSDWVALTESQFQLQIDPNDLSVKGRMHYVDRYPELRTVMSAHPQYDFSRGQVVNAIISMGPLSYIAFFEHSGKSRQRREITRLYFQNLPYLHSFGYSPRFIVLVDHPLRMHAIKMLWSNRGFIDTFTWKPKGPTYIHVYDRQSGRWHKFQTKPFFCFHTIHAHEEGDTVVLDLIAHENADFVFDYRTEALRQRLPEINGELLRLRMRPGQKEAKAEVLSKASFEFPSVSYRRAQGQAPSRIWGAGAGYVDGRYQSYLVAVDSKSGEVQNYQEPDMVYGEPVFVGRPGGKAQDDGVLLVVGSHLKEDRSTCLILDASSFKPLARVGIDVALPLGFHGSFFAGET